MCNTRSTRKPSNSMAELSRRAERRWLAGVAAAEQTGATAAVSVSCFHAELRFPYPRFTKSTQHEPSIDSARRRRQVGAPVPVARPLVDGGLPDWGLHAPGSGLFAA